ncbi:MAG: AsmA family protein [Myxococcota bacterium]|nr:AsmA family protein [Myxococcota bacterium]
MRRVATWTLGILLVTALAVALALQSVNLPGLRVRLAQELSQATGYPIEITGELALGLFPHPGVSAGGVRIASPLPDQPHPLIEAKRLDIRLALLASLRHGSVRLQAIELEDVDLWLRRDANGQENWSPPEETNAPSHAPPHPATPGSPSLEPTVDPTPRQLDIVNMRVHFFEAAADRSSLLELSRVDLSRAHKGAPVNYHFDGKLDSEAFEFAGTVTPDTTRPPSQPRRWSVETTLSMKGTGTRLSVQGVSGVLPDLSALSLALTLESDEPLKLAHGLGVPGLGAWSDVLGPIKLTGQVLGSGPESLRIKDAVLSGGRKELLELKISGSVADILSGTGLEFDVSLDSPNLGPVLAPLELGVAQVGASRIRAKLRGSADAPRVESLEMTLSAKNGLDLHLRGELDYSSGGFHGGVDLTLDGPDLQAVSDYLLSLRPSRDKALRAKFGELKARPMIQHLLALHPLEVTGRLSSNGSDWSLSKLDGKLGSAGGDGVEVSGQASKLWPTLDQLALTLRGHLVTPAHLLSQVSDTLDAVERVEAEAVLSMSHGQAPALRDLKLSVGMANSVEIEARGKLILAEQAADQRGQLALSVKAPDLAAVGKVWGGTLPALGPFLLRGDLAGTLDRLELTGLVGQLGSESLRGQGNYAGGGPVPVFDLELQWAQIDLVRWGLGGAGKPGESTGAGSGPAKPSDEAEPGQATPFRLEPAQLAWLSKTKGHVALEVGQLTLSDQWVAQELSASFDWSGGVLRGPTLDMHWPEGKLSLRGELDAREPAPALALGFAGNGFPLGSFVRWGGYPDLGTGLVDATLHLSGRGSDLPALEKSLAGGLLIEIGHGKVSARYADAVALSLHIKPQTGDVPMNCLIAALHIEKGIAHTDALLWDTPEKQVRGMGFVNIPERSMDILFRPHLKQTLATAITAAVRVKGPLGDLSLRPEPLQTATDLTRGLLGRAVRVVAKVSPQISDAVKDLGAGTDRAFSATGLDVSVVETLLGEDVTCTSVRNKSTVVQLNTYTPAQHFPVVAPKKRPLQ